MTSTFFKATESMTVAPAGLRELVRGCEAELLQRVGPLARRQSVLLDLCGVERIDAAGVAALIMLYGMARDQGHRFGVAHASAHVTEILALVGLDRVLVDRDAVETPAQIAACGVQSQAAAA